MKTTAHALILAVTLCSATIAVAKDPVPYPDVGGGGSGGDKVDVSDKKVETTPATTDSSGTLKSSPISQGKTTYQQSSSKVKMEGKNVVTHTPLNNGK